MRKRTMLLALFMCLLLFLPSISAENESFVFTDINASVLLPADTYQHVLTAETLKDQEEFISSTSESIESLTSQFEGNGLLLKAFDQQNDRILVISAQKTSDSEQYFDINMQATDTRASYRKMHKKGEQYKALGYDYKSAEWTNERNTGRWLMLKYQFLQDGAVKYSGVQRRTIRNGYTITIDLQNTSNKGFKESDNTAIKKVLAGFQFTSIQSLPELPIILNETTSVPAEISEPTFVLSGKTESEAHLVATISSFSTNKLQMFETTSKKNGEYKLSITLPAEDYYVLTLMVEKEGSITLNKQYPMITFKKGILTVQINDQLPKEITENRCLISGKAEKGSTASLTVNGKTSTKKLAANGAFRFNIDTSAEGDYVIDLSFSKEGFETRSFQYTGTRKISEAQKEDSVKNEAISPTYAKLMKNKNKYDGKMLAFTGYLVSSEEKAGEWIITFALEKKDDGYRDLIILSSEKATDLPMGSQVKVYGVMVGMNTVLDENQKEKEYPKLAVRVLEQI